MRTLVTGVSGYVGAELAGRLRADGHLVRGFARSRARVTVPVDELVLGDVTTGAGLDAALDGIDVAYYLVHSMEQSVNGSFAERERSSARAFAAAAEAAVPEGIGLRASIVIGARSRSFRFLVRLIERLPVMALPAWRSNRTAPIDGRDVLDYLARAATAPAAVTGRSWDIGGPDVMTYADMITRISDAMMVRRPSLGLGFSLTPVASVVAAAISGEDPALIEPLMESLDHDLLPRDGDAAGAFGVRLHSFDAAVERALREWERTEELAAR